MLALPQSSEIGFMVSSEHQNCRFVKSFPKRQIPDCSKLKEFADDNFKFDGNGAKFSKRLETLWEKEKLLVTSNFFFCHNVFKRLTLQTRKEQGLF